MSTGKAPFTIANVRLFLAFRVLFNARFYYPVFTILFLDFGLTIEQFALLNTIWAITIVLSEVPTGALADLLGRKYLIVATSLCMVLEMSLLAFVPLGNSTLIFAVFLANRILSGLAEAMASGADEAIAYDSLQKEGSTDDWPKVLSLQMRLRSIGSILTMTAGALVYDPVSVNKALAWFGSSLELTQQTTMRFPIYLTLLLAILATLTALRMTEVEEEEEDKQPFNIISALKITWEAGLWIGRTPFAFAIILIGMIFDHILRMFVTMTSQYFRLIDLPEASFGLIGSAMGLLGLVTPKIAEKMAERNSPTVNMFWVAGISLVGLFAITGFYPYWGLVPVACIFTAMMFVSFFTSHYLNSITDSKKRATVLSFKGLAFNLAYGFIGIFFAILMSYQRGRGEELFGDLTKSGLEDFAFQASIDWFPWYLLICFSVGVGVCRLKLNKRADTN